MMARLGETNRRLLFAMLLAVAIFLLGGLLIHGFASLFSIRSMLVLASFLGIAAVGQTLVTLIGGIDLSIPFMIGFANVVAAKLNGDGVPFGLVVLLVLMIAGLVGAFNGAMSSLLKIHPLIVTLGVGNIIQGAVSLWTKGFPTGSAPDYINQFVSIGASTGPLPFAPIVLFWLLLAVVLVIVLERTVFGRQLYALGSNPEAARLALVRPVRMWAIAFALSGIFAAVCGIFLLGFTGSAFARVGEPYLFQSIAAVVIGGTSLMGGRGSYTGTLTGAIVLIELTTVLIGLGLSQSLVQTASGFVIIVLVSLYGREQHVRNQI
ncbi:MAG: ABC transporter permease [Aggregatilineales bacterium]